MNWPCRRLWPPPGRQHGESIMSTVSLTSDAISYVCTLVRQKSAIELDGQRPISSKHG